MEFGNLLNLWWYIIAFFLIIIFIFGYNKRKKIIITLNLNENNRIKIVKMIMITIGIFFIIFSLTEPKLYKGKVVIQKKSLDIYVLMDVSKSMLSTDLKPNRLVRMKEDIDKLMLSLKGDRIGFIPFASDAYIQMPLTDDYDAAKMFLDVVDTNMIVGGGTNISKALVLAQNSFDKGAKGDKIVIIFSDGEDKENTALETVKKMKDIIIYSVGVGTETGSMIPEQDESGTNKGFKTDDSGKYVVSKINKNLLKSISIESKGKFYMSTFEGGEISKLIESLTFYKRDSGKEDEMREYSHFYQIFLGIGIVFFLSGYFFEVLFRRFRKN